MRTRIIATLGPASDTEDVLGAMVAAGMTFARLNFSHGDHAEHRRRADLVRHAAKSLGRTVDLIQDLQGPKIRTVHVPQTQLHIGDLLSLGAPGQANVIPISEPAVLTGVQAGQRIYLDDGAIELEVTRVQPGSVDCRVLVGGPIEGNEGVVFPSSAIDLPALTERDIDDLAVGRDLAVEWVALSFVQRPEDIDALRQRIDWDARIIAKIETAAALDHLDAIVERSDAVMVARGDLGVAIRRARVPLVQKDILYSCRQRSVHGIVATEMLLSMVQHSHPTRAEVGDVATAVLDGCHAVMLSEETAIGAYPTLAVAEMREIIETVEASPYYVWD
ncbi:MAG: pyruvate kinase [Chloroflexi bacterium]|nr:pyruvate kinase [Chloroflexota bacterium]